MFRRIKDISFIKKSRSKLNSFKFYFKKTNTLKFIDENLYEILNIDKECKPEEIKIAYKKLIEEYKMKNLNNNDKITDKDKDKDNYNDTSAEEESKLKLIELAYETLSNEMTREMYNAVIDGYRSMYGVKYRKEFYKKFYGIDIDDNENDKNNNNNNNNNNNKDYYQKKFNEGFNYNDFFNKNNNDYKKTENDFSNSYSDNFTYKENIKKADDIEVRIN
jgi:DnaJ-class molecular chaperone